MTDTALSIAPPDQAMPKVVWLSIAMMLVQLPIGLINLFFFQPVEVTGVWLAVIVVITLIVLGLIALIALGYGWVRHFYVVSTVLTIPQLVLSLPQRFHSSPMNGAWVLVTNLWFYAALAMLYAPSARAWFRGARLRRQRGL